MGFWSCLGGLALAVVAAPVVLPAAGAAAVAAGTAAAAGAATAATAVGGAVAATGAAAATAAATVGSAAAAAGTMAAGAATAVGGAAAGAVTAVATKGAVVTGAKIVGGAIGTGIVYDWFDTKLDEAEANGRKQGYKHGYTEGKIKAAEDFKKMLENNENLLFGVFAMALYVARLDGEAEQELAYIKECLGHERLRSEEIRHEIQSIYQNNYNFYEIRARYLDKVSLAEIEVIDDVINGVMEADGSVSEKEKQFYVTTWQPYVRRLKIS